MYFSKNIWYSKMFPIVQEGEKGGKSIWDIVQYFLFILVMHPFKVTKGPLFPYPFLINYLIFVWQIVQISSNFHCLSKVRNVATEQISYTHYFVFTMLDKFIIHTKLCMNENSALIMCQIQLVVAHKYQLREKGVLAIYRVFKKCQTLFLIIPQSADEVCFKINISLFLLF